MKAIKINLLNVIKSYHKKHLCILHSFHDHTYLDFI